MPAGDKLKGIIANKLDIRFDRGGSYNPNQGDANIVEACRSMILDENGRGDINPLIGAGRAIASAMGQSLSIDNYLHAHAGNQRITEMGKLGIASAILEAERNSSIFVTRSSGDRIEFNAVGNSWHNTFAKMLSEGVQRDNLDTIFDNVGIITFNYDRCIEHYLASWLSSYFLIQLPEAQELLKKLEILHPYGQVGKLPWQSSDGEGINFGAEIFQASALPPVSRQLRTFTERVEDDEMMDRMHNLLGTAEKIVYLGFAFGPMNMELLTAQGNMQREVYGTVMGISPPNVVVIKNAIQTSLPSSRIKTTELAGIGANQLLNDYWRPILA
ncbi:hypothetical protein [Rhizobium sp. RAF56]|uniref:hypothetical protein n=1 Tax=Rhizobium sp. RAF56 TaxID=3233062 RepID=UPI003F9B083B